MRRCATLAVLACAGCTTYLEVTVTRGAGPPLAVDHLVVVATNNGQPSSPLTFALSGRSIPPDQSFALQLDADRHGDIAVDLSARDGHDVEIGHTGGHTDVIANGTAHLLLPLGPPTSPLDGSANADGPALADAATDALPDLASGVTTFEIFATSPVTERKLFSVTLTARDAASKIVTSYHGTPQLTSTWGDLTSMPTTIQFIGGVAALQVMLNRETNTTDGPARIVVQDGTAAGQSSGLVVVAPPWQPIENEMPVFSADHGTAWDGMFVNEVTWIHHAGTYYLYYYGAADLNGSNGHLGVATSITGLSFIHSASPIIDVSPSGWDVGHVPGGWRPQHDGTQFLAAYGSADTNNAGAYGLARSQDGVSGWTRDPLPFLTAANIDANTSCQSSFWLGFLAGPGEYRAYTSNQKVPCVVASPTATGWPVTNIKPITADATLFRGVAVYAALRDGGVYRMWMNDGNGNFIHATSSDGQTWVSGSSQQIYLDTVLWNETANQYEALGLVTGGWARFARP